MPEGDPTRIIVRNMAVFLLRAVAAIRRSLDGSVSSAFVFSTLRSANISHIPYTAPEALLLLPEAGDSGDHLRRGVSVNAVARSFGMPYETVRSCINGLIKQGLVIRREDGVLAPGAVLAGAAFRTADDEIGGAFIDVLRGLVQLGVNLAAIAGPPAATETPPPPSLIARIAIDAALRSSEAMLPRFGDLTNGLVYSGVLVTSSARLLDSPEEAWRYAAHDAPPSDAVRKPVSVRAVAAALDLPFETTRRHVNDLVKRRMLIAVPDKGFLLHPDAIAPAAMGQANAAVVAHAVRIVTLMAKLGFDFEALKADAG
jgi:hypothetical protein